MKADDAIEAAGPLCRGVPCQCPPGQGHNHWAWIAYETEARAKERYADALRSGLSDHEAREEGWPSQCRADIDWHTTPHMGCILR